MSAFGILVFSMGSHGNGNGHGMDSGMGTAMGMLRVNEGM